MTQFPTLSGSSKQASLISNPGLGRKLAIRKINSGLEYNGYSLTNLDSGFVNQEALL